MTKTLPICVVVSWGPWLASRLLSSANRIRWPRGRLQHFSAINTDASVVFSLFLVFGFFVCLAPVQFLRQTIERPLQLPTKFRDCLSITLERLRLQEEADKNTVAVTEEVYDG